MPLDIAPTFSGLPNEPRPGSPLDNALRALDDARSRLDSGVIRLSERLDPLLAPATPRAVPDDPGVAEPHSDVVTILLTTAGLLDNTAIRIDGLLERLEV